MTATTEKLIKKIRALLGKTVDRGCTQEEAMVAAARASKLMAEHDLSQTDIELGATRCVKGAFDIKSPNEPITKCASAVAAFTDTRVWLATNHRVTEKADLFGISHHIEDFERVVFFSLPHDVEIANYLTAICRAAMERGAVDFRSQFGSKTENGDGAGFRFGTKYVGRFDAHREFEAKLPDFLAGMAMSMSKTLRDMKRQRDIDTCASSGRDLVAVKTAIVEAAFTDLGIHLGKTAGGRVRDAAAYHAGSAAGANVRFHAGVGRSGQTKQIGN